MRVTAARSLLSAVLILVGSVGAGSPTLAADPASLSAPDSSASGPVSADFVAGTEDVPLAPGLATDEATLLVFDKPEGRIVEVEARGGLSRAAVEHFYAESLPPLGWAADGPHQWRREGERLRLSFKGRDGDLRVGFSLSPK